VDSDFSHVYPQGTSLYMILLGQAGDDAEAEQRIREIWDVSMTAALQTGAVTSHHHGAGIARLPYLAADLGSGMTVLAAVKRSLDPNGILNPGKLGLMPKAGELSPESVPCLGTRDPGPSWAFSSAALRPSGHPTRSCTQYSANSGATVGDTRARMRNRCWPRTPSQSPGTAKSQEMSGQAGLDPVE
jgi:hypothetical protein